MPRGPITPEVRAEINAAFDYLIQDILLWPDKRWLIPAVRSNLMHGNPTFFLGDVDRVVEERFNAGE